MDLNYKLYGKGPALIILHGLFGSLDNWATHARRFSEHFSVYLVDQRNHGRSFHSDEWNYEVMAEDLAGFMDSHGIYNAHLLGHSMGGKTVMQFANHYPHRVDKLIVADMAPKAYEPHHTKLIETLVNIDLSKVESRQTILQQMTPGIPDESVRQFLMKGLGRNGQKSLSWKFNLPVIATQYQNVIDNVELDHAYSGETLFLSGGRSDYLEPTDHDMIREFFPNAVFEVITHAGHWLHAEAPEEFMDHVMRFLE